MESTAHRLVVLVAALALGVGCTGGTDDRPTATLKAEIVPTLWYPVSVTRTRADIVVATGGCKRYHHATVEKAGGDARLVAFVASTERSSAKAGRGCTDEMQATPATVNIPLALQGRRLIGACSLDAPLPDGSACRFLAYVAERSRSTNG